MHCVLLDPSGSIETVCCEHTLAAQYLGGPLSIVGCIPELGVVAVGLRSPTTEQVFPNLPASNFDPVQGDVLLVRTDEHAEPRSVHAEEIRKWFDAAAIQVKPEVSQDLFRVRTRSRTASARRDTRRSKKDASIMK